MDRPNQTTTAPLTPTAASTNNRTRGDAPRSGGRSLGSTEKASRARWAAKRSNGSSPEGKARPLCAVATPAPALAVEGKEHDSSSHEGATVLRAKTAWAARRGGTGKRLERISGGGAEQEELSVLRKKEFLAIRRGRVCQQDRAPPETEESVLDAKQRLAKRKEENRTKNYRVKGSAPRMAAAIPPVWVGADSGQRSTDGSEGEEKSEESTFSAVVIEESPEGTSRAAHDEQHAQEQAVGVVPLLDGSCAVPIGHGSEGVGAFPVPGLHPPREPSSCRMNHRVDIVESTSDMNADEPQAFSAVMVEEPGGTDRAAHDEQHAQEQAVGVVPLIEESHVIPIEHGSEGNGRVEYRLTCCTRCWINMCSKHRITFYKASTILLAMILAAVLGIKLGRGGRNENSLETVDPFGANTSSISPKQESASTMRRFNVYKEAILSISSKESLSDLSSPQFRALDWLANKDTYANGAPLEGHGSDILQRYALAVLFFATGGDDTWTEKCHFLESVHECNWNVDMEWEQIPDYEAVSTPSSAFDEGIEWFQRVHKSLNFTYNFLGTKCIDNGTNVDTIRIYRNSIKGVLPTEIGALTGLIYLSLWENQISGYIPSTIGNLSRLQVLNLMQNKISGSIPMHLSQLLDLTDLGLANNHITGQIPTELNTLQKLEWFNAGGNSLTGTLPITGKMSLSSSLRYLELYGNFLTGSVPEHFDSFSKMKVLDLGANAFTSVIPRGIGNMVQLEFLFLPLNTMSGDIPPEIGNATSLVGIWLFSNHLSSTIPRQLGQLSNLLTLDLYMNRLSGSVPSEIGSMTSLEQVEFSFNQLHGPIPREIGHLTNLRVLALIFNSMSGTLPTEMDSLTQLETLVLDVNRFTGTIPHAISDIQTLSVISMTNNSFTGDINIFCNDVFRVLFAADCFGNSAEVTCDCCHFCCSDTFQGPVAPFELFIENVFPPFDEVPAQARTWNCFWGNQ